MLAISAARPRSAAIIRRRRSRTRSSHTPASSENSRCGSSPTAVSVPIWVASAPSVRTATSGSPSWVIWSPKTEIVWPSQRRRKSGASKRSGGMKRRMLREPWATRDQARMTGTRRSGRRILLLLRELPLDFLVDLGLAVLLDPPDHVQTEEPRPEQGHDQPDERRQRPIGIGRCPEPGEPV